MGAHLVTEMYIMHVDLNTVLLHGNMNKQVKLNSSNLSLI